MNKAMIMGRMVRDPETKTTSSQIPVCTFTLAVDRRFKNTAGERQADFIPCVAWRQQAEMIAKYFRKGSRMIVVGSIQTRNWDDTEGKKHFATEIIVEEVHFAESKKADDSGSAAPAQTEPAAASAGYFPGQDDDTSLPFDI